MLLNLSQTMARIAQGQRKYVRFVNTEEDQLVHGASLEANNRIERGPCHELGIFTAFLVESTALFILLIYIMTASQAPSDMDCARQLSPWSPYLDSDDLEYDEFLGNNHLMQPSIYRGKPTLEIEEAWETLYNLPPISVPGEQLKVLQKGPESDYLHVAPEYGGEVMGYLDIFHQLHCLNTVRQYIYRDEYDYSNVTAFRASDEIVRGHVDHCIETVRKALMCASDVTPIVVMVDETRPEGRKTDFDVYRKCRNYSKIQQWALKHHSYPEQ